jgi:hypothetical protein
MDSARRHWAAAKPIPDTRAKSATKMTISTTWSESFGDMAQSLRFVIWYTIVVAATPISTKESCIQ